MTALRITRHIPWRYVFLLIGVGAIVYYLLTGWAEIERTFRAFTQSEWWWLIPALALSALTYAWDALQVTSASEYRVPFGQAAQVSLAGSFANVFTPGGLGTMGVDELYYARTAGMGHPEAVAAVALKTGASMAAHGVLLLTTFGFFGAAIVNEVEDSADIPDQWWVLLIVFVVVAAIGGFMFTRLGRRYVVAPTLRGLRSMWKTLRKPKEAVGLFGSSFALTLTNLGVLLFCLRAFGSELSILAVATAYFLSSIITIIAPSPGGIGVSEVAYAGSLTALGEPSGIAVAGALVFRFFTFWLPLAPGFYMLHHLEREEVI